MTHLRYLHIGVLVSLWWEAASPFQPWPVPPRDIMADITNDLGICLLQVMGRDSRENIAFSPYGVMSVVFLLYEGSHGNTAVEMYNTLRLPWDRHMSRIGFRDLHRHIKSYFSNDRFLKGLVLSKPSVPLRNEYVRLLNFYGFYPNRDGIPSPPTSSHYPPPGYPPQTDHHEGRNPTSTAYYPSEEPTYVDLGPLYTTPATIDDYTTKETTNTPSTFATFPNFEPEPTLPPYEPTKSASKTTTYYPTIDETEATQASIHNEVTKVTRRTTTSRPTTHMTTVRPGYNGHGMTQFFTDNTPTESISTGNDDDNPTLEDNIIFTDDKSRQTTRRPHDRTEPYHGMETENVGYTQKKTTVVTEPTIFEEDDKPIIFPEDDDNHVEYTGTTETGPTSTTSGEVVFPTDDTNENGDTTGIDIRFGSIKKSTTASIDRAETTSTPLETTASPKITHQNIVERPVTTTQQNPTTEATTRQPTTVPDTKLPEEATTTAAPAELIRTVDTQSKSAKLIMTRKDVQEANDIVETMDKTVISGTTPDFKPTLATILSTIAYANLATDLQTDSSVKLVTTEQVTETTEQSGDVEVSTVKTTPTTPAAVPEPTVTTTVNSESPITYTNLRMPISREMAAENSSKISSPLKNSAEPNATESERWKRSLIPPELPYDHRDGSTNWIPAAEGPHWEYSVPRDQWFYSYSGSEPVPVLTYCDYLPFALIDSIDTMALQLPLDDPRYSMLILLPLQRYGLEELLASLNQCSIRDILQSLRVGPVYAVIPAFTLVKRINIVPALTLMGIEEVFDPLRADLSGMAAEPHLFVRSIEQLVTVSLRKYHYTSRRYDGRPEEIRHHFIANHPFVYFVLDTETNAALMAGTVVNPTAYDHPNR